MNLAKITIQKINQPNLKIEVYRVFENDDAQIENFYLLTELEKQKYHFATINQDEYFEVNFDKEEITLYDVDKYTYENSTKYDRDSVGIQYHTFLSNSLFVYEPNVELYESNFMYDVFYNTKPDINNGKVNIKYYLIVKKIFMQSVQPETRDEVISVSGFNYNYNQDNYKLTLYIPSTYDITIKKVKENNRLVQYGDKYYYVLPALDFKSNNVKNEIQTYCKKLGGNLMIINTKQELVLANYLAQTFTNKNNPKYGYVYCNFTLKPFNPQKTATIKISDITSFNLDDMKFVKLTEMNKSKYSDVRFLASSGLDSNPSIGYCDPSVNLPFIIEFDKTDFETKSNALLQNLYENSELIKFGNFSVDGIPGSEFCILPENIKKREYQYQSGYLIGNYNRHCLLCFLTKQKFIGYNHAATFSSPITSHEPDDDCIVMVISAVDSDKIYKYDTLSFIVKLNNDQTHCGVPANVKCALVYNVFLENQIILKEDTTFVTNSNWNNFSKGMAIKAIKTAEKIDIYRTDMRNGEDDEFDKIDPEQSSPVLSMTFSQIEAQTGIDFSEGYLGYGNISQAETWIKNIDIVAEDADIMNDLKSKSMEYIAATASTNVILESNDKTDYYDIICKDNICLYDVDYDHKLYTKNRSLYYSYDNPIPNWVQNKYKTTINSIPNECLFVEPHKSYKPISNFGFYFNKLHDFKLFSLRNKDIPDAFGSYNSAFVVVKQPNIYNDKIVSSWDYHFNSNVNNNEHKHYTVKSTEEQNCYMNYFPNFFRSDIAEEYKNFTYDAMINSVQFTEDATGYHSTSDKVKIINRYEKFEKEIDAFSIVIITHAGKFRANFIKTADCKPELADLGIPYAADIPADHLNISEFSMTLDPNGTDIVTNYHQLYDYRNFDTYYYDNNFDVDYIVTKCYYNDSDKAGGGLNISWELQLYTYDEYSLPRIIHGDRFNYNIKDEHIRAFYSGNTGCWNTNFHNYIGITNPLSYGTLIKDDNRDVDRTWYKGLMFLGIPYSF